MIVHIISEADWNSARERGSIVDPSLSTEGFIHCSDPGTVHQPANYKFRGRDDMVVAVIDPKLLGEVAVKWEPGDPEDEIGEAWFPHVFGEIPFEAVIRVEPFLPHEGGLYRPFTSLL